MIVALDNTADYLCAPRFAPDFASGEVVRIITDDQFRVPTTGAIFGNSLYLVNARFDVVSPFDPPLPNILDIEYDVVKVPK